jgi:drug/metabolite transporter superfamily protein YnfA
MRTLLAGVPITISPLEWTAVWTYLAALIFSAAYQLTAPAKSFLRVFAAIGGVWMLFTGTALVLEDHLFFNTHDTEKSDTSLLLFGCTVLAAGVAIFSSIPLGIIRNADKRA